jgi:hypothetical protein
MRRNIKALALVVAAALVFAGCGFGFYSDDGQPVPGVWWPFVCDGGGTPDPDAGCPVPACVDGGSLFDGGCG